MRELLFDNGRARLESVAASWHNDCSPPLEEGDVLAQIQSPEGQLIISVLNKTEQLTVSAAKPTDQALPLYEPTLEEIQARAYEIYVQRGRIDGLDLADWFQAEKELKGVSTHT